MKITAILLFFKEEAFVQATLNSIYPHVDKICCVTGFDRNYKMEDVGHDDSIRNILKFPDPENKLQVVVCRSLQGLPGKDPEAQLRNAAIAMSPEADYYMIVDSDEVWEAKTLRACLKYISETQYAAYRVSSYTYFKKWNYRAIEPGFGYRPLVFVKGGFKFNNLRQISWRGWSRWKEYFRTFRKPKTVYFPHEWKMHHGSSVGDDARMKTKLLNYGHSELVDPTWFDRVWKNFDPSMKNLHYFKGTESNLEGVTIVPTEELPDEIKMQSWPEGWID